MWRLWKQRLGFRWLPQDILAQSRLTRTTNSRKACFLKLLFPAHAPEGLIDCAGMQQHWLSQVSAVCLIVVSSGCGLRCIGHSCGRCLLCRGMCRAFAAPGEEAPQGAQRRRLLDSVWTWCFNAWQNSRYAQVIRTLGDASSWQDMPRAKRAAPRGPHIPYIAVGCLPAEDALELLADMCKMDPKAARAPRGRETVSETPQPAARFTFPLRLSTLRHSRPPFSRAAGLHSGCRHRRAPCCVSVAVLSAM